MHDAPLPAARLVRRIAIFVTFIGALAGAAPPAVLASTYEVRACDAAPGFVNNSWSPEVTHGGMAVYPVCPSEGADNGGLVARHVAQPSGWTVPSGAAGRWWFWAPPGAAVVGIRANATFDQWDHRWQVGLS